MAPEAAARGVKFDDDGPQNWVVPEVMKPDEEALLHQLTASLSKNTYHQAKKAPGRVQARRGRRGLSGRSHLVSRRAAGEGRRVF